MNAAICQWRCESREHQLWRSRLLMANFSLRIHFFPRFSYKYEITISALWWWLIQNKEINQIISREWQRQQDWMSGGTDWRDDDKTMKRHDNNICTRRRSSRTRARDRSCNLRSILDFLQFRSLLHFFFLPFFDLMYGPIVNKYLTNYRPATLFYMMGNSDIDTTPHITRDPIIIIKLFHHKLR